MARSVTTPDVVGRDQLIRHIHWFSTKEDLMFSQSADENAPDQSPAPIGMRELPPQPARPVMPAFPTTPTTAPEEPGDEAGPGPDDSVIARDDHFEGTFTSRGTVRVEGSVDGRIEAVRVRIQEGAKVEADVIVDEAIVAGEFTGNLTCRQRLEARPTGQISGRVETFRLMLHEGASVEGEMHMLTDPSAASGETIRGTASVRGDGSPTRAGDSEVKAPAPRAVAKPSAASAASATSTATTATAPRDASRPEARGTARVEPSDTSFRVAPRGATAVSASANGSTSNGVSAEGNVSRL
jgi:cytoskeletal protein CcmA (bactofilin family)